MDHFLTIKTASDEVASQLHPNNAELRQRTAAIYYSKLSDALRAFDLAGHDPENYALITRRDLAGAIALGGALISETALNGWLAHQDLGVEVHNGGQLPPGDEGDRLLLAEKERLTSDSRKIPGGIYRALAKKYRISEDNAEYRCKKAKKLRGGSSARSKTFAKRPAVPTHQERAVAWPGPFVESQDSVD